MKERPILFSGPMVRAILAGRKTQTRRVVKSTNFHFPTKGSWFPAERWEFFVRSEALRYREIESKVSMCAPVCPYGQPGDRLWVRETWHGAATEERHKDPHHPMDTMSYRATDGEFPEGSWLRWKPSTHMPRWASRITLEIISVRVERLHDISEEDARAEGVEMKRYTPRTWIKQPDCYRDSFIDLWGSINGADSWGANPWVWVVEFKRIQP